MPLEKFQDWQNSNFGSQTPAYLNLSNYLSNALTVERAASKIFLSNSIVFHKAAIVFYSKNTFRFVGEWSWDEVVVWLQGIGPSVVNSILLVLFPIIKVAILSLVNTKGGYTHYYIIMIIL